MVSLVVESLLMSAPENQMAQLQNSVPNHRFHRISRGWNLRGKGY
jgi:hypothetical protein